MTLLSLTVVLHYRSTALYFLSVLLYYLFQTNVIKTYVQNIYTHVKAPGIYRFQELLIDS